MVISGFDKLTLLNYPDNVSCMIFTSGCNFNCPFCHNSSLINTSCKSMISEQDIFDYLEKRKNILDGVCISGGEPLIHKDITRFITRIKELGLKVKLDTNGSNPSLLKKLINEGLVDYVAMDIKNSKEKYNITSGVKVNIDNIKESIKIIENSDILYEFRTTLVKEYHELEDIISILKMIKRTSKYYLQNFVNSDGVNNKKLNPFSDEELLKMKNELEKKYPNVIFRDI